MEKKSAFKIGSLALLFIVFAQSCRKDDPVFKQTPAEIYTAHIAHTWFDMFRSLTKVTTGFTPPVAARAFGYAGLTIYETVVGGMPEHQSLVGQVNLLQNLPKTDPNLEYNWEVAANSAMATVAKNYYATAPNEWVVNILKLEQSFSDSLKSKGLNSGVYERSKIWGETIAKAIFEYSKTDGGHEGYSKNFPASFVIPVGLGFWEPTFPNFQRPMQPYWGNNRTFVEKCAENTQPTAPIPFGSERNSIFYENANIVYLTVKNLAPEQRVIAQFWSDDPGAPGTPPGHSISITTQVLKQEKWNLARSAETYAKVGMAVSDAFVSCWKCKYDFNYMRPITYIRRYIDPNFVSLLGTPPFPEYTSGHSVQSGALSKVLSELIGENYAFTDRTHAQRTDIDGTPRLYLSFKAMAAEAAISRLYGGIHYQEAIDKGITQGEKVGTEVGKLKFKK
jgi:membrane-associated phospholipid phosphatase